MSAATPWYGEKKKAHASENAIVALAFVAVAISGCSGCYSLPDGEATEIGGADTVQSIMDQYGDGLAPEEESE